MSKTTYPAPDGHFIGVHIRKCTVMPGKKECLINGLLVHYVSSTTLKSTTITQVKAMLQNGKKTNHMHLYVMVHMWGTIYMYISI